MPISIESLLLLGEHPSDELFRGATTMLMDYLFRTPSILFYQMKEKEEICPTDYLAPPRKRRKSSNLFFSFLRKTN